MPLPLEPTQPPHQPAQATPTQPKQPARSSKLIPCPETKPSAGCQDPNHPATRTVRKWTQSRRFTGDSPARLPWPSPVWQRTRSTLGKSDLESATRSGHTVTVLWSSASCRHRWIPWSRSTSQQGRAQSGLIGEQARAPTSQTREAASSPALATRTDPGARSAATPGRNASSAVDDRAGSQLNQHCGGNELSSPHRANDEDHRGRSATCGVPFGRRVRLRCYAPRSDGAVGSQKGITWLPSSRSTKTRRASFASV